MSRERKKYEEGKKRKYINKITHLLTVPSNAGEYPQ